MDTYAYNAALYCEACIKPIKAALDADGTEDNGDSNVYPQYIIEEGGGEADSPQFCDQCHEFLENPLTDRGYADLRKRLYDVLLNEINTEEEVKRWRELALFYFDTPDDLGLTLDDVFEMARAEAALHDELQMER